jgi:hypothetical protein
MLRVLAFLVTALSISACGGEEQEQRQLVLRDAGILRNGDLSAGLPIRFDPFDFPRLQELKQREQLGVLMTESFGHTAGVANTEFESILRIKNWVAAQWPHSDPNPYPPWDAIVVLDWIREGRTGGFCGQYSQVMLQALASFGIPARYIEIGSITGPADHFVIEVWSNDFDKWVVMDADYNVHFERHGIPLGALELRDALMSGATDEIVDVLGDFRAGHSYPDVYPLRTMELYYHVRVMLNANHLSAPDEPPFDRINDMVEWDDGTSNPSALWIPYLPNLSTSDRSEFNAKLNQVKVSIGSVTADSLYLRFETNYRNFRTYHLKEVYPATGHVRNFWSNNYESTFVWKPNPGYRLEVRAVGQDYRSGPPAIVEARFELQ